MATTTDTHRVTVKHERGGYVCAECSCGREFPAAHSTRTIEGFRLAERDGREHVRHMAAGPSAYCSIYCPHVTKVA